MKILGITGSPRGKNSNTLALLESALNAAAEAGAETEIVDITKLRINYCLVCDKCYETGICPVKDDFNLVYDKFLSADGIILASPVYFNSVSAQLKTFIDRTVDCRHCLLLQGKYGMAIATTASSGAEKTIDYLNEFINMSGALTVGGVSIRLAHSPESKAEGSRKAAEMGRDLVEAIKTRRPYPEQAVEMEAFVKQFKYPVMANKKKWAHEYEYYMKKGWL